MYALAITDLGVEWAVAQEVKEILGFRASHDNTVVKFKVRSVKDIKDFNLKTRASRRVILYIGDYYLKNFECVCDDFRKILKKFIFDNWFKEKTTFKVVCGRKGNHDFVSKDVEEEVGGIVIDSVKAKLGFEPKVNLKNPDIIIYCHIHEKNGYIGIDFSGKDLSKRDYKLYSNYSAIRGNIAYSLVRYADYDKDKVLLDPFAGSGVISIEAALFGGKIHAFDSVMKNIRYAQSNSKIAGVKINFSKTGIDYLDTKFEEGEVDCVVTYPPQVSKAVKEKDIKKIYDEFLYQCRYLLNDKGSIVVLMRSTDLFLQEAKKHGFKLRKKYNITTGEIAYTVLKLRKA